MPTFKDARGLGVALWSIGNHARRNLLPALRATSSIRLIGVLSRDSAKSSAVSLEYGIHAFTSPSELLASPEVDAVVLAGPNATHFEHALAALEAGKHVFVEKSMTCSLAEAVELAGAAESRGLLLAECFMFVHHPQFKCLKATLASGRLGPVRSITSRFGFPHLSNQDIRYSRLLGGGALADVGAYCIAAILEGLEEEPVKLAATVANGEWGVDIEGSAMLTFRRHGSGSAQWGFGRSYVNHIEVWCRDGWVVADRAFAKPASFMSTLRIVHQEDNREEVIATGAHNHFVLMFEELARAAHDQPRRASWRARALRQARVMESVRTGKEEEAVRQG